ncbi:hypothetical protein YUWDRAFT_01957 [Streptomyces sp. AmelKG-D3]|nr:hypothetical protein YUWDRAFT_01957 [Streptomyces sp. AmelKG-D3]
MTLTARQPVGLRIHPTLEEARTIWTGPQGPRPEPPTRIGFHVEA